MAFDFKKEYKEFYTSYRDLYVNTSFGKTHLVETGNLVGEPLLVFHGGNASELNLIF